VDDKNTYKISQHAKERYAERLRDKDNIADITQFIVNNESRIVSDINLMIRYGTMIYEGKQIDDRGKGNVQVFLKDTWVIIADAVRQNVITLYSIDLGLGAEFNKEYIGRMIEKIDTEKKNVADVTEKIREQRDTYQNLIEENQRLIEQYSSIVKSLKKQNEDYQEIIQDMDVNLDMAEASLRQYLGRLIGKKSF